MKGTVAQEICVSSRRSHLKSLSQNGSLLRVSQRGDTGFHCLEEVIVTGHDNEGRLTKGSETTRELRSLLGSRAGALEELCCYAG